jgi:hypothetical protein
MPTTVQEVVDYVLKTPLNTNKAILNSMLVELAEGGGGGVNPDGTVQLRRDNDYNYNKIGDSFIPANGEICLVDTARDGLRAKCGDGKTVWNSLDYIDEYVVKGYYFEGNFYKDRAHKTPIVGAVHKIYIDLEERVIYFFNDDVFISTAGGKIEPATESKPGVMKLYQTVGQNTDGTMSQKAIADELDDKVEVTLNASEELLIFTY